MKPIHFYLPAAFLLVAGSGIIAYACSHVLPGLLRQQAAAVTPAAYRDTVTIVDTVHTVRKSSSIMSVYFSPNKATPSGSQQGRLLDVLDTLQVPEKCMVLLDGYSDNTGASIIDNNYLSSKRSFYVYSLMVRQGIPKDRIYMRSFGAMPTPGESTDSVRRVDISISLEVY